MKKAIEESLHRLQIFPISNSNWQKFKICIRTDSTEQEYSNVKKTIRKHIPKGTGGVYIITRDNKVLYVGESEKDIQGRIRRHIEKIYIRTDSRSTFFKLEEHQGPLSIYYWTLPPDLIGYREAIEDLLTIALEPEYKTWDLQNKMSSVENAIREANKKMREQHKINSQMDVIELEDGDFYDDDLDKDDMLDRLGQSHSPTGRLYWEKFVELNITYGKDGILTVNIGADNPTFLESEEAFRFATDIANRKSFTTFYKVEDDIRLYGQNCLTERMFYFQK